MSSVLAAFARAIERPAPWWSPHLSEARRLPEGSDSIVEALNAARVGTDCPMTFVHHSELSGGEPYESFIFRNACVPTRENMHDLLNGLMWLRYPRTKRRLNELQAREIAARGTAGPRGALRDALTVFDENAAVLRAPAQLVDALRRREWNTLFGAHRAQWRSAELLIFGHALLEKLMEPRKPITAHVWVIEEISDSALAASLTPQRVEAKPFLPLPVLGVPGWWSANEEAGFYDDPAVFRQ
jgi:hypothetical protein